MRQEGRATALPGHRGRVHDGAAAVAPQAAGGLLATQEDALGVDVHVAVPVLFAELSETPHGRDAGVGHPSPERAQPLFGSLGCSTDRFRVEDIQVQAESGLSRAAVALAASSSTSVTATAWPASAKAEAMAAPMPDAAPVIRTLTRWPPLARRPAHARCAGHPGGRGTARDRHGSRAHRRPPVGE